MNKAELLEWYFAFLRKDAHLLSSNASSQFTPMALVKADQELIEKTIEKELAESIANTDSSLEAQKQLDDLPLSLLNERSWLLSCIFLCSFAVVLLLSSFAFAKELAVAALLACIVLAATILRKRSNESKLIYDLLKPRLTPFAQLDVREINEKQPQTELTLRVISPLLKQLELMQQKELLLFDYCPHILCELNEDGKILALNKNAGRVWGYSPYELIGRKIEDLLILSKDVFLSSLQRCQRLSKPESIEICTRSKTGNQVHLLWRNEWSASAKSFFCFAEDISIQVEYDRLKTEMSTMITHDLRAPISGLVFWTDNMLSGCYGELGEDASYSLKQSSINLRSVLRLLDNLLAVDKLDSGLLQSNKNKTKIQDCFKQIVHQLSDWAKDSQINLEIENTDLAVVGDLDQINRILTNYCSNAIKWSPAESSIRLRARVEGSFAIVEVEDQGPGISGELKESLFQRWVMSGSPTNKTAASSGIGLYIAKKFAELQGGTVGARSGDKGGSIFWFSLPLAKS